MQGSESYAANSHMDNPDNVLNLSYLKVYFRDFMRSMSVH